MAYVSEESGTPQVYVQSFPGPGAKWQISSQGGIGAAWMRNGRELFYTDGKEIFSVAIAGQPCFASSKPRTLISFNQGVPGPLINGLFDVAPDGQRFLVVVSDKEKTAPEELHLEEDWLDELTRTVQPGTK